MNEKVIAEALWLVLSGELGIEDTALDGLVNIQNFRDAGLLTLDDGLVITMDDGSEFQLTIKQSW